MRVLVVDDDRSFSSLVGAALRGEGLHVTLARSLHEARAACVPELPDLFLLDRRLPDGDGLQFLAELRKKEQLAAVIMVTAHGDIASAVEAIRLGASDYLPKPVELDDLVIKVRRALEGQRLRDRLVVAERELAAQHPLLPTRDPHMLSTLETISRVARSTAPLLLFGETGVGKEVLARFFHREAFTSDDAPFVHINCAAVPSTTFESELFGHEAGAFTDARARKRGLVEVANGGTLFLDELGELPLALQAKLLTFLDHGRFRRLGGSGEITSTARVVAATNRQLEDEVTRGEFRGDLFFRIAVFKVVVPPLRERRTDIVPLAQSLLTTLSAEAGRKGATLSKEACERLAAYSFPGNVRELKSVLFRALVLEPRLELTLEGLGGSSPESPASKDAFTVHGAPVKLEELSRRYARYVLEQLGGKRVEAAAALGISYPTFLKRIGEGTAE